MIRLFSQQGEPRRKSRRFVPGGVPVGVSVEHLEHRIVLDGNNDITPAVQQLMDLIDTDLGRSDPSGDDAAHFDGMEIGGTDSSYIADAIEAARTDLHTRLDAKIAAYQDWKTLLQGDIIRIKDRAAAMGWAEDWYTQPNLTGAQKELFGRIDRIARKIFDVIEPATLRLNNLEAWDDTVFDFLHAAIEYHQQQMGVDGDGNPTFMRWITVESFAEAEDDLLGA